MDDEELTMVEVSQEELEDLRRKAQMFEAMNETEQLDDDEEVEQEHELQIRREEVEKQKEVIQNLKTQIEQMKKGDTQKLQRKLEESEISKSQLQSEVNKLQKKTENLGIEKQSLLDRNNFLQLANDKLMKETMKYSEQYLKLCEQIGDYQKQNTELKVQNEHLSATKQNWEDQLNAKNKMIEWYKRQLESGEQALVEEVKNRANKVEELMDTIRSQAKQLEDANIELEQTRIGFTSQKALTDIYAENLRELTVNFELQDSEHDVDRRKLLRQAEVLKKHFDNAKQDMEEKLEREVQAQKKLKSEMKEVHSEKRTLEKLVKELQKEKHTLKGAVRDLEEEVDIAKNDSVSKLLEDLNSGKRKRDITIEATRLFKHFQQQKQSIAKFKKDLSTNSASLNELRGLNETAEMETTMHKQKEEFLRMQNNSLHKEVEDLREFDRQIRHEARNVKMHYDQALLQTERLRAEIADYLFVDGSGGRAKKTIEDILADNEQKQQNVNMWKDRYEKQGLEFEKQLDLAFQDIEGLKGKETKYKREFENVQNEFDKLLRKRELEALRYGGETEEVAALPQPVNAAEKQPFVTPVLYADVHLEKQFLEYRQNAEQAQRGSEGKITKLHEQLRSDRMKHLDATAQLKQKVKEMQGKEVELKQMQVKIAELERSLAKARQQQETALQEGYTFKKNIAELEVDVARLNRQLEQAQFGDQGRGSAAVSPGSGSYQSLLNDHLELFKKVVTDDQKVVMQQKETQYIQAMKQIQILETDLNSARERAQRELEQVNQELLHTQNKLLQEEKRNQDQKDTLDQLNKKFEEHASQLQEIVGKVESSSRIGVEIRDYELENFAVKKQNKTLKESFDKLQSDYDADVKTLREKFNKATKDLESEKSLHKQCNENLKKVQSELKSKIDELAKLNADLKTLQDSESGLKARNAELEQAKSSLDRMLQTSRAQLQQATAARTNADAEREAMRTKAEAAAPELQKLRKEKEDSMREVARMKNEQANRRNLAMENNKLRQEKIKLEKQVSELSKRPAVAPAGKEAASNEDFRVKLLQMEKQDLLKREVGMKEEIMRLEKQIEQKSKESRELQEKNEALHTKPSITGGLKQYDTQRKEVDDASRLSEIQTENSAKVQKMQQEIENLKALYKKVSSENNSSLAKMKTCEKERDDLQSKLRAGEQNAQKYRAMYLGEKKNTTSVSKSKEAEITSLKSEKRKAEQQSKQSQSRNAALERNQSNLKQQLLTAQKNAEQKPNEAQKAEIRVLKTQMRLLQNKNDALRNEKKDVCSKFDEQLKKLVSNFESQVKQIEEWKKSAKAPLDGIDAKARLTQHINRMASLMKNLEATVKRQKETLASYIQTEADIQKLNQKVKQLTETLQEKEKENARLTKEKDDAEGNANLMKNHAQRLKSQLEEKTREAEGLMTENNDMTEDYTRMEEEIETLKKEADAAEIFAADNRDRGVADAQSKQREKIETLEAVNIELKGALQDKDEKLKAAENRVSAVMQTKDTEQKSRVVGLEGALKQAESSLEAKQDQLTTVTQDKDNELSALRTQMQIFQQRMSELEAELEKGRKQFSETLESAGKEQSELIESLKLNNQQLVEERDHLRQIVQALQEQEEQEEAGDEINDGEMLALTQLVVNTQAPPPALETFSQSNDDDSSPRRRKRLDSEDKESRKRRKLNEQIADDDVVKEPVLSKDDDAHMTTEQEAPPESESALEETDDLDPGELQRIPTRDTEGMSNCATIAEEDLRDNMPNDLSEQPSGDGEDEEFDEEETAQDQEERGGSTAATHGYSVDDDESDSDIVVVQQPSAKGTHQHAETEEEKKKRLWNSSMNTSGAAGEEDEFDPETEEEAGDQEDDEEYEEEEAGEEDDFDEDFDFDEEEEHEQGEEEEEYLSDQDEGNEEAVSSTGDPPNDEPEVPQPVKYLSDDNEEEGG